MSYLQTAGLKLPDDPDSVSCLPFLKSLLWCYGPTGVWNGLYREGVGTSCVPFMDRFVTCAQVKLTPGHEKRVALLADAQERLRKEEKLPDRAPVWKLRTEPPAMFHHYQTMTDEEWEEEFQQVWGMHAHKME